MMMMMMESIFILHDSINLNAQCFSVQLVLLQKNQCFLYKWTKWNLSHFPSFTICLQINCSWKIGLLIVALK